jgi:hypothetical protein
METGGVTSDAKGFSELANVLSELQPVASHATANNRTDYNEVILTAKPAGGVSLVNPEKLGFTWGEEYVEARYETDADWDETDYYAVGEVYRELRSRIRSEVTRLRLSGLVLLASGFGFQFLGTAIGASG